MSQLLSVTEFFAEAERLPLLDARAPGEYAQGHIPGAVSFPLFSDAERAEVGTLYKQVGKEAALLRGLELVGPKMAGFVREAVRLAPGRALALHCWRGGQRSQSMAWLLKQAGFRVEVLSGGYKAYRRHVLDQFSHFKFPIYLLGGRTGTGKTRVLRALAEKGEQILDLEKIARHKGSSFGSIGEAEQPTVEQFENDLFEALRRLDPGRRTWVENESRSIGRVYLPQGFWAMMRYAALYNLEIPLEGRLQNLLDDYVGTDKSELEHAFRRIEKKIGGQHLKAALEALNQNDYAAAAEIALRYYDKTYQHGLDNTQAAEVHTLPFDHRDPEKMALACLALAEGR